jgi:hypothetical protein
MHTYIPFWADDGSIALKVPVAKYHPRGEDSTTHPEYKVSSRAKESIIVQLRYGIRNPNRIILSHT